MSGGTGICASVRRSIHSAFFFLTAQSIGSCAPDRNPNGRERYRARGGRRKYSLSGTSSSPLSVAMIAISRGGVSIQALLDIEMKLRGRAGYRNRGKFVCVP